MPAPKKEAQKVPQAATKKTATAKKPVNTGALKKTSVPVKIKQTAALPKDPANFPIVGIGASAGGLEALEIFLENMPAAPGIAIVIIQHLSPKHKSIMTSLLRKHTPMTVLEIEDGMKIKPGCVYLNPPDKNVTIINRQLYLTKPLHAHGLNLPIDSFFRSLSEDLAEKAICIILSGTATDGTLGIKAVKGGGGMAMVQDPDSAKYAGMPNSAIATGLVDFILPLKKIPAELIKYVQHPYIDRPERIATAEQQFMIYVQKILGLIRTRTGHDFSKYKQTTIRRRIERRMAVHQLDKLETYIAYLEKTPAEVDILFKDLLIGVTSFFRDNQAFEILNKKVIPQLMNNRGNDAPLRIWVAGCATGEEAYSLAILFAEALSEHRKQINIQIFASDIDKEAIEFARGAIYPDSIAADVSPERLDRFFLKENDAYRVRKQIRDMIVFAPQNLIKDPPFSRLNLLTCRNLLIYMEPELQKKLFPLFHYTLVPNGFLFLGTSESIGGFSHLFSAVDAKWKIFKHKPYIDDRVADYPRTPLHDVLVQPAGADERVVPTVADIHNLAERIVLENYAQPCVLINDRFEILHFIGRTDRYLSTPSGKASFNILKMAREGLRYKLNTTLHQALKQKKTITSKGLEIKHNSTLRTFDLIVRPMTESTISQVFMLVIFDDKTAYQPVQKNIKAAKDTADPYLLSLEQELLSTREYLQSTNEELETSNEELKSTNEELQSLNEELQSTNEELETSKEELQSTNEELVTVNAELLKKIDELSDVNNDINNLLASTEIGTIFLDINLRIRRFTPAVIKIFNLIHTDIGRPISDITTKIPMNDLYNRAKDVLQTLVRQEFEMQDENGVWYSIRIMPYRTLENVIDGVVINFVDVSNLKEVKQLNRLATVVRDSNDAVTVQDFDGNILAWNKGATQLYGWSEAEALKMNIREIVPQNKRKELAAITKKIKNAERPEPFVTQRLCKNRKVLDVWLTFTGLKDESGRLVEIATTERDITELKKIRVQAIR
jgi:two-component system CheB/CheR fusion protein